MANLTFIEKTKLEKVLGMSGGYVLDFSNRTFQEFVAESVGLNVYDPKYSGGHSGSKANHLRSFWKCEDDQVVGKLLHDLIEYFRQTSHDAQLDAVAADCMAIASRLMGKTMTSRNEPLVFISYAHPDLHISRALAQLLGDAGLRTWFDKKDLHGGQDWELIIRQRIEEASLVVICLSTRAVNRRGFFHSEMRYAVGEAMKLPKDKVYIIPVRLDDCEIPDDLRQWHTIDLYERQGSYDLLRAIGDALKCGTRAQSEAHDALFHAIEAHQPFVVEEGQAFNLSRKVLAGDRCMYDFELSETMLGYQAVKFWLRVRKYVVGRPVELVHDESHGLSCGEDVTIAPSLQVELERVDSQRAYFLVKLVV